ncbi:MAG: acyl-CoA thioesterase [Fulvivirga sp.]
MYSKDFEIRWADIDANRHVANSSYVDLLTEARMSFLRENGFSQSHFESLGIGPVIFTEEFYYIKEIRHNEKIKITIELLANDKDYKYIKFAHCIFNTKKELSAYSETFFGWFNLKDRKLIQPPDEIIQMLMLLNKADRYELLGEQVNLKHPKIPFSK